MNTMSHPIPAALLLLALAGCSAAPAATPSSAPASFTVRGTLTLTSAYVRGVSVLDPPSSGHPCSGIGGFSDLTPGAQVKVSDAAGRTLALGQLDTSMYDGSAGSCTFAFTVADTPAGQDFYGVTVGGRGGPQFTYAQMKAGPALTIGD